MAGVGSTYPVSRSKGVCAFSGHPFQEGQVYVAALIERPGTPDLERQDFSVSAWNEGARPARPARLFGSWRAVFHKDEPKRKHLLSDDELLDLFEDLGAATESRQLVFRYVLALLLVRRRLLRLNRQDGKRLFVLRKGQAEETPPLEVVDPGMDDAAVADAIEQLAQVVPSEDGAEGQPRS